MIISFIVVFQLPLRNENENGLGVERQRRKYMHKGG